MLQIQLPSLCTCITEDDRGFCWNMLYKLKSVVVSYDSSYVYHVILNRCWVKKKKTRVEKTKTWVENESTDQFSCNFEFRVDKKPQWDERKKLSREIFSGRLEFQTLGTGKTTGRCSLVLDSRFSFGTTSERETSRKLLTCPLDFSRFHRCDWREGLESWSLSPQSSPTEPSREWNFDSPVVDRQNSQRRHWWGTWGATFKPKQIFIN